MDFLLLLTEFLFFTGMFGEFDLESHVHSFFVWGGAVSIHGLMICRELWCFFRPLDCSEALSSRWRRGTSGFQLLVSGVELLGFCQICKTISRQKTTIFSSRREILSFKSAYLSTYPPLTLTPSPWWGVWKLELGTRSKAQHWQHSGVSFGQFSGNSAPPRNDTSSIPTWCARSSFCYVITVIYLARILFSLHSELRICRIPYFHVYSYIYSPLELGYPHIFTLA